MRDLAGCAATEPARGVVMRSASIAVLVVSGREELRVIARDAVWDGGLAGTARQRAGVDVASGEYVELVVE